MITMKEERDFNITRKDYRILEGIYRKGKITPTLLATEIGITQPDISNRIQKFFDADIVRYDIDKRNRRMKWFYLTTKETTKSDINGMTFLALLKRIFEEG